MGNASGFRKNLSSFLVFSCGICWIVLKSWLGIPASILMSAVLYFFGWIAVAITILSAFILWNVVIFILAKTAMME